MDIERFIAEEDGQDVVEYSLLLTLIAAAGLLMLTVLGLPIQNLIGVLINTLNAATDAADQAFQ